jgi:hypothetical protein
MGAYNIVADGTSGIDIGEMLKNVPPVFKLNMFDVVLSIVISPGVERLPEQAYFWTSEWQEGEREADEDIRAGRVKRFSTAEEAIAYLRTGEY